MSKHDPADMIRRVSSGLLSFPVTHFDRDGAFAEDKYRAHCSWLLGFDVGGLFAAGGTGEFFSLSLSEVSRVVRAAVQEAAGRTPVIAGCGYGTAIAADLAVAAEQAGADGLLLLPPYLVVGSEAGLEAHVETVCRSTSLGVILYNRDNAILREDALQRLCETCPNLVGLKDGVGDVELMTRIYARLGDRLAYIGGLPTAEMFALPYLELGAATYSSAIFNFMPEWALNFYASVRARDLDAVMQGLRDFVIPYVNIRNRKNGYAVAIVKAGLRVTGRDPGPVRPPLSDLSAEEEAELSALIQRQSEFRGGREGRGGRR